MLGVQREVSNKEGWCKGIQDNIGIVTFIYLTKSTQWEQRSSLCISMIIEIIVIYYYVFFYIFGHKGTATLKVFSVVFFLKSLSSTVLPKRTPSARCVKHVLFGKFFKRFRAILPAGYTNAKFDSFYIEMRIYINLKSHPPHILINKWMTTNEFSHLTQGAK